MKLFGTNKLNFDQCFFQSVFLLWALTWSCGIKHQHIFIPSSLNYLQDCLSSCLKLEAVYYSMSFHVRCLTSLHCPVESELDTYYGPGWSDLFWIGTKQPAWLVSSCWVINSNICCRNGFFFSSVVIVGRILPYLCTSSVAVAPSFTAPLFLDF